MTIRGWLVALCALLLGACGGGGGGSDGGWTISGTVFDAGGAPVDDAQLTVTLDETHVARTDSGGNYRLRLPPGKSYPAHFTGVVEKPGMRPQPVFFEYDGGVITWDNPVAMDPVGDGDVILPSTARVIHLGDSRYEGSINSQFQLRDATGTVASEAIVLDAARKARYTRVCVSLHAKGINPWSDETRSFLALARQGVPPSTLTRTLPPTNEDGSYAALRECFSLASFPAGSVLDLQVHSGWGGGDYDDFEFVGLIATFE